MRNPTPSISLRNLLLLDAATCTVMGAVLTLAATPLMTLTAIPAGLLFYAGLLLFPIAAFMTLVATKAPGNRPSVWLIIVGNILWVTASLWLMVGEVITPNGFGYAFLGVQALAVAILAVLERAALQRTAAEAGTPASII